MDPRRGCLTIVGALLVLLGIPMLVCPGPGLLVIGIGMSLILTGRIVREMEASAPDQAADQIIDAEFEVLDADAPLPVAGPPSAEGPQADIQPPVVEPPASGDAGV